MSSMHRVRREHLSACPDEQSARALFAQTVGMIEIEVFTYCNRVCWFCPNKDGSRLGPNQYMDEDLYLSILNQLSAINYSGMVTYSRYNEPLSDRIILKRIAQARQALPTAQLHTNTNGDYLTRHYLEELRDAGLNTLNVQIYLKNQEQYDHEKIREKGQFILRKLGLPHRPVIDTPGQFLEYGIEFPGTAIRLYGRNFATDGTSRGDTVDIARDYIRNAPCCVPATSVFIDYNGSVMPCCNLRSDIAEHADAVLEKLTPTDSLFRVYGGAKQASWRRHLYSFDEKSGLCRSCRFSLEPDTSEARRMSEELLSS